MPRKRIHAQASSIGMPNSILAEFNFFKPIALTGTKYGQEYGRMGGLKMKFENEKFENENRTERIEMRIEPTLKELFGDAADEQGMTMTGFIRTFMIKEARKMQKKIREGKAPTYSDQ